MMKRLPLLLITLIFLSCSNDDNDLLMSNGQLVYNEQSFTLSYAYKIEFDFTIDDIHGFEIILTDQPVTFENSQLNLSLDTKVLLRMVFLTPGSDSESLENIYPLNQNNFNSADIEARLSGASLFFLRADNNELITDNSNLIWNTGSVEITGSNNPYNLSLELSTEEVELTASYTGEIIIAEYE
ncbi:hypothetical protein [Winogradskyella sp. SYSU M77433]|uniref:hypothetical protein n=1 Tax=Winogradskyella sp. SYSU M77433 TaxID=3042722 RepID=UPI002480CD32|nr:hypothetical protein [Winogradskyella sp. SYSU M77433]MDH7913869.1 hypothetical protein [Winogradskyella sp. SYSU M77433]